MIELNFTPFPNLTTERLFLRQLTLEDDNEIFKLRTDERVLKYIAKEPYKTLDEAQEHITKLNNGVANNENIIWAITLKNDIKLIGTIGIWNISKEHQRAETGYMLLPDFQGKGIMQEALKTVINYGFKNINLHSLEANVHPKNLASRKLLERNNFIQEAYFKENYYYDGIFFDTVVYSLVKNNAVK